MEPTNNNRLALLRWSWSWCRSRGGGWIRRCAWHSGGESLLQVFRGFFRSLNRIVGSLLRDVLDFASSIFCCGTSLARGILDCVTRFASSFLGGVGGTGSGGLDGFTSGFARLDGFLASFLGLCLGFFLLFTAGGQAQRGETDQK